jgi:hypothetical protein
MELVVRAGRTGNFFLVPVEGHAPVPLLVLQEPDSFGGRTPTLQVSSMHPCAVFLRLSQALMRPLLEHVLFNLDAEV